MAARERNKAEIQLFTPMIYLKWILIKKQRLARDSPACVLWHGAEEEVKQRYSGPG
jgi:hypothetical protein